MIETIQQAVIPHDQYQIELKLDYSLLEAKQTHYQISTFIFVPQNLGINPHNYRQVDFYRDVRNYIRLKTPIFALTDFTTHSMSPLAHLNNLVANENWATYAGNKEQVITNCKLFSAMLKSAVREHIQLIQKRIAEAPPDAKIQLMILNLVEAFLEESKAITSQYRALYAYFNLPNVDAELFTAYKLTDESMSLLIEESAVEIFSIVADVFKKEKKALFKTQLSDCAEAEIAHRRAHGYASILEPDNDNEDYAFRTSVLKKYASSVLYLSTAVHREGAGLEQLIFAIAAGLSMIFATVVAFYFQARYGNFTFPFFMALVVGYMFKDRIKEWGRVTFAQYLQNRLFDRRTVISTQDGKHKLGILKENMAFIDERDLPKDAIRARNRDSLTELDNDGLGENIICYTKEIKLYNNAFREAFHTLPEITGINDITRYNVGAYVNRMDEPYQEKAYLAKGQLHHISIAKVYHINLITRYRSLMPRQPKVYKRIRMILHQKGIKRLEQVEV